VDTTQDFTLGKAMSAQVPATAGNDGYFVTLLDEPLAKVREELGRCGVIRRVKLIDGEKSHGNGREI
jgi:hypothetical protein